MDRIQTLILEIEDRVILTHAIAILIGIVAILAHLLILVVEATCIQDLLVVHTTVVAVHVLVVIRLQVAIPINNTHQDEQEVHQAHHVAIIEALEVKAKATIAHHQEVHAATAAVRQEVQVAIVVVRQEARQDLHVVVAHQGIRDDNS